MFEVTATAVVDVHPLTGFVTISVYPPGDVTTGFGIVEMNPAGPIHRYVTPGVVEDPVKTTAGCVQVILPLAVAVAPGLAMFCVTVAVADPVWPSLPVTVTV
jgi:hypothetical protein